MQALSAGFSNRNTSQVGCYLSYKVSWSLVLPLALSLSMCVCAYACILDIMCNPKLRFL